MEFADRVLLQLCDPARRGQMLDPALGRELLEAAYVFDETPIATVTQVRVRGFAPGFLARSESELVARVQDATGAQTFTIQAALNGPERLAQVDARLDLVVTLSYRPYDTTVESVVTKSLAGLATLPSLDAQIVAEDGGLPASDAELEARRLRALTDRLLAAVAVPADLDVAALRERFGLATVAEFLDFLSDRKNPMLAALDLAMTPLPSDVSEDVAVTAYLSISEGQPLKPLEHVREAERLRDVLRAAGELSPPHKRLASRVSHVVLVACRADALDDTDLPTPAGTAAGPAPVVRAARLSLLNARLRSAGVVFVASAP